MKKALITGVTGQDGSYLAELLLEKGYQVFGVVRRSSFESLSRIMHLRDRVNLLDGELADEMSLIGCLERARPDEVYNLASQSFVGSSWDQSMITGNVTGLGTARMLEATRRVCPAARFYQASSSEMFGRVKEVPQRESTPFHPRSPYGAAKAYAHHLTVNFRESYGMFAVSGILFNHESPRRGTEFVTRKISRAVAAIRAGTRRVLHLGNLDAQRDWGYAPEYVEAMWRMLQQDIPEDYVIATGETHSVRELCEAAFAVVGLDYREFVRIDPGLHRPAEVDLLQGDASKARERLGWAPSTSFAALVKIMVEADIEALTTGPERSQAELAS